MAAKEKPYEPELERVESYTALPMLVLSALLLPALILPTVFHPSAAFEKFIDDFDWAVWGAFTIEYCVRLYVARNKRYFILHNLIDLATILLPLLRPLRFAQSTRALRLLRVGRVVAVGLRSGKVSERMVNRRSVVITGSVVVSIIIACAGVIYDVEHAAPGANILTSGDAFWWAVVTVASVGYGDRYPVTTEGRFVAGALMFCGTCLTGLIAGAFTSVFIEQKNEDEFGPQLLEIREQLGRIDCALLALAASAGGHADDRRSGGDVARDYGPGRDDRVVADADAG